MAKDVEVGGEFQARDYRDQARSIIMIGYKSQVDPDKGGQDCDGVGILGIAWAFDGMIFILVYCTAGGHINPAVTFGLFLARKVHSKTLTKTSLEEVPTASDGYSTGTGLAAEIIGTFVLVYIVFSATDPKRNARDSHVPVLAPLPIGFAVFMVHLATILITGTGINPARSYRAAVMFNQEKPWDDHEPAFASGFSRLDHSLELQLLQSITSISSEQGLLKLLDPSGAAQPCKKMK
ncbi:hypothetical protein V6N13_048764 [Hibiscus sabdariffa]